MCSACTAQKQIHKFKVQRHNTRTMEDDIQFYTKLQQHLRSFGCSNHENWLVDRVQLYIDAITRSLEQEYIYSFHIKDVLLMPGLEKPMISWDIRGQHECPDIILEMFEDCMERITSGEWDKNILERMKDNHDGEFERTETFTAADDTLFTVVCTKKCTKKK